MSDVPTFKPGQRISAGKLNAAMDLIEQSRRLSTARDHDHSIGVEGSTSRRVDFPFVWGRLIEGRRKQVNGCWVMAYRWKQQEFSKFGHFVDMVNGYRSDQFGDDPFGAGSIVQNLAYEANGSLDPIQPGQDIVVLWPGNPHPARTEWLFVRAQCSSFWAKLTDRQGDKYEGEEVVPQSEGNACDLSIPQDDFAPRKFRFEPDESTGELPALHHILCQSHNSQAGAYPEIVRVWEFRFLLGGTDTSIATCSVVRHYFEYSVGPHELDSERWEYDGTEWDRNNAPDGTKGVALKLLVAP